MSKQDNVFKDKEKLKKGIGIFAGGHAPGLKNLSTCNKERLAMLLTIRKERQQGT